MELKHTSVILNSQCLVPTPCSSLMLISVPPSTRDFTPFKSPFRAAICSALSWNKVYDSSCNVIHFRSVNNFKKLCVQNEQYLHSKNRIVTLTICLLYLLQMSEPIWCMDTVNCQDGMIMWRKVGWEWGKDCHVVLLHMVMNCVHPSQSEITHCQSIWQLLLYSALLDSTLLDHGSTSLYLTLHYFEWALLHSTWLYITIP